jgi:hypothetical protein
MYRTVLYASLLCYLSQEWDEGRPEENIPQPMRVILSDMKNNKLMGKKKSISLMQYPSTGYYMCLVCTEVSSLHTLPTRDH